VIVAMAGLMGDDAADDGPAGKVEIAE